MKNPTPCEGTPPSAPLPPPQIAGPYAWLPGLILAVFVAIVTLGALGLQHIETRLVGTTGESLALAAADIADKLDRTLYERYGDIHIMAQNPLFQGRNTAAMSDYLHAVKRTLPIHLYLSVTDARGRVIAATNPASLGKDLSGGFDFRAVRERGNIYVRDAQPAPDHGGIMAVTFTAPIKGARGEFLGAMTTKVALPALEDVFEWTVRAFQVQRGPAGKIEYQFLDRDGNVIADSILRQEGKVNLKQLALPSALFTGSAQPGYVEEMHLRRRIPVVTGYAQTAGYGAFTGLHWGVLVRMDRKDILSPIRAFTWTLGLTGSLVLLPLLGFLIWTIGRLRREWAEAQAITARATAVEGTLRESEERYRMIVETALDAVITMDRGGVITGWNSQAEGIFGWSPQEAIGRPLSTLIIPPPHREAHERGLQHYLATGKGPALNKRFEITALHRDGHEFPVELSLAPGSVNKQVVFTGFVRDITEQKRAKMELEKARSAAEEASRAKSEFVATMSHEIRTPMNGVIGMTGLLLDTKLTTEQREYAETIRRSGDALLEIINDILDFSKIEAGKLHLDSMNFDLWTTVEEVIAMFAEQAETKGLEMACVIPVDVPHALRGDPGRLRQILTNLVGNAVKFTAKGEVVVRVTVAEAQEDGVLVRFEVTDTGIGISPEGRARLFQSFSQVDGSTTRRYGGTGLGLAICKKLTELMGGEIGIESAEGQGSTVWFTARLEKQSGQAATAPTSRPHLNGVRALIVDDNKTNRTILTHQVGAWGMRGESADDGPRGLELLRAAAARGEPFQLAILDMMMPGMDGLQLARAIKADPALKSVRLVMLSSFRQLGRAEEARQAGIEVYLTKPVRHSLLHDALAKVMGGPAPSADAGAGPLPPKPTRPQAGRSRGRILVVEDNIVNQRVAVRMLEKLGYRVDVAADGREGLDMLSRTPYTAVLMDCQMPEMDGFEATQVIRAHEATRLDERRTVNDEQGTKKAESAIQRSSLSIQPSRHIPIIAMTANAMQGDREKCLAAGMDDYIAKPVKLELFEEILGRWIKPAAPSSGRAFIETTAPASPDRTLQPPLDPTVLADLRALGGEDDPEFLNRAIGCFLRDTPKRLGVVRDAVGQGNARGLEQAAHSLKGSCSNIGARQMVALCLALEERGRAGSVKGAETLLAPLDNAFARVREVIEGDKVQANPGSKA